MSSSARRGLKILETVGGADRPLGVTEIARRLDLAPGTVFRSLDALERGGYVARYQASSRCVLGGTVARLRQSFFAGFPLREVCLPYLRQLAFASGETAALIVPVGWYGVRIAAAPGTNEVTSSPPLGDVCTLAQGNAQAILAFLPPGSVTRFTSWARSHGMPPPAPVLDRELRATRKRGFTLEATAFASGRAALALPIRGPGRAVASIAIEGPVLDLAKPGYHDDLPRWIEIVRTIETLIRTRPALVQNPFDRLDPDSVVLATAV